MSALERPKAGAPLFSALTTAAPARVTKKLDANPTVADGWVWSIGAEKTTVVTDGNETVTLNHTGGLVAGVEDLRCTCLLAPRCLHVLAVVAVLDAVVEETVATTEEANEPERVGATNEPLTLTASQVAAARLAWRAASETLGAGALGSGAVLQADILRAAHDARSNGLHRLAAAALRVVRGIRDLRAEAPEFALGAYADDLGDLLTTAHALGGVDGVPVPVALEPFVGLARRAFAPVGDLQLAGLFTEGVIAGAGYAGVVSYLCDRKAGIWTVSDVLPGPPSRAMMTYEAGVRIGDVSLAHRVLAREGLFIQGATGSADMRLGAAASVRAVRSGATQWSDEGARALWEVPIDVQIARAYGAAALPVHTRRSAATLVFFRGIVRGSDQEALVVDLPEDGSRGIRLVAPSDHEELCYRGNLRILARARGLGLHIIGRILSDRPRTLAGLAIGPWLSAGATSAPALRLPGEWGGRVMLGLDRLQGAHVEGVLPAEGQLTVGVADSGVDPLAPFRRRVQRVALAGMRSLPSAAMTEMARECATLERRMMPTASAVLRAVVHAATAPTETGQGAAALARAWLAAVEYERRARFAVERAAWRG